MIKNSTILIVSDKRSVRRAATRALVSAGCKVQSCSFNRSELESKLETPWNMLIIDSEAEEGEVQWTAEQVAKRSKDTVALLLSSNLADRRVLDQVLGGSLNNVVARQGGSTAEIVDETELITTAAKLITGDIFGLEKYLPNQHMGVLYETRILRSDERASSVAKLEDFLEEIDCYQGIRPMITAVADELLMNAIFSAPRDRDGKPKYDARDRRDVFALEEHEAVDFQYACDGKNVLLSVSDRFGSLDRDVILRYLGQGLMGEKGEVEYKKGGAGLGLYMVVHSISQLVFNIRANRRTEVIAAFFVRSGLRGFRSSGQSLNLFLTQ